MIEHKDQISRKDTRILYDRLARWYGLLGGVWENRLRLEALRMLDVQPGETTLEIGPGPGHALVELQKSAGQEGKIIGIDLSFKMLCQSRLKVLKEGLSQHVYLVHGDAAWLPLESGLCGGVFMSFTLELFASYEIPAILQECARILCREGKIGIVSLSTQGTSTSMSWIYKWAHRRFPRLVDCRPISVQEALEEARFQVQSRSLKSLWGLPVEIVIARKQESSLHDHPE